MTTPMQMATAWTDHVPIIIIEIAGGAVDQGQAVAAGRET